MPRKMMPEEKELRKLLDWFAKWRQLKGATDAEDIREIKSRITTLVRAVREDCAKVAENYPAESGCTHRHTDAKEIAAAIREMRRDMPLPERVA